MFSPDAFALHSTDSVDELALHQITIPSTADNSELHSPVFNEAATTVDELHRKSISSENSEWGNFVDLDVSSNKPSTPSKSTQVVNDHAEHHSKGSTLLDANVEEAMYSKHGFGLKCCPMLM